MVQNLLIRRGRTPGGLPPPRLLEHDRCLTDGSSGKLPLKVQRVKSQSWSCSAGCGIRQNLHDFSKIPTLCMLSIRWWYPWGCIPVHTCTYYYYTTYIYYIEKHANPCKSIFVHVPLWNTPKKALPTKVFVLTWNHRRHTTEFMGPEWCAGYDQALRFM